MSNEFVEYKVIETSFGASTSLAVKFSDGKVAESINTSTGETNYRWDGGFKDGMLEGKTKEEADELMEHWFDNFEDEYRQPQIAQLSLSENEWKKIKAQRIKRDAIWKKREDRFQLRQKNKDVLKEKEQSLNKSVRMAQRKKALSNEEEDKIRLAAYKKFTQERRM